MLDRVELVVHNVPVMHMNQSFYSLHSFALAISAAVFVMSEWKVMSCVVVRWLNLAWWMAPMVVVHFHSYCDSPIPYIIVSSIFIFLVEKYFVPLCSRES